MGKQKKLLTAIVAFLLIANAYAQDWPQYLGPNGNSSSPQKDILRTFPQDGPQVLWTVNIGIGFGGPVIKSGKAYLLDRDDQTGDKLRCFDLATGKELWSFAYDAPGTVNYPGSRSVPAIDGNRIYSVGPYGHFYCIDINTHKPLWNKNIWTDFGGGDIPRWAVTQCPLIMGDLVIVASQAPKAGVVAYEKLTGKVKWATPSLGPVGYVSPSVLKVGNENHVVMITAASGRGGSAQGGKVVGIDPAKGNVLWEYSNFQCGIPVPSAVDAGEGRALISGGYEAGSSLIKVSKKPDGTYNVAELFRTKEFGAHTQPPVLANGYFYAQYSTNERKDGLVCMSMEGEVKWKTMRKPMFDKGGIIYAGGLLIVTDGMTKLYLVEPDPSGFKPVATAEILKTAGNSNQNWAPPALGDGKLLMRDQKQLVCIKIVK
jgi:outer membrane protein assembly factor BamB